MKKLNIFFIIILGSVLSKAQDVSILTLDDAIKATMSANLEIAIAENDAEALQIMNSPGFAGQMPSINFVVSDVYASNNLRQLFASGLEVNRNNVVSNNINAAISLQWILYNGRKLYITRRKLQELESGGVSTWKEKVQNLLLETTRLYGEIHIIQQQIKAAKQLLELLNEQTSIADTRFKVGLSPKTDWLQSVIEYNRQKSNLLNFENKLYELKIKLNILMNRTLNSDFTVQLNETGFQENHLDSIKKEIFKTNPSIAVALTQYNLAIYNLKIAKSQRLPQISLNSSYSFNHSESQAGFALFNRNFGPNIGIAASVPLFNGNISSTEIKTNEIQFQNAKKRLDMAKIATEGNFFIYSNAFKTSVSTYSLEKENVGLAEENLAIIFERFKKGHATSFEVSESRQIFEQTVLRKEQAACNILMAETQIKWLTGNIQ